MKVSEMVTFRVEIAVPIKIASVRLADLHLTLAQSKGYSQGHVHFRSKSLVNCDRCGKQRNCHYV